MILAAGYGTRLWPLTVDRTKPAIPLLGKPLVGYVAEYLARFGFNDVVINLHHRPESVRKALGDGLKYNVKLHYVLEEEILGTSGALDNAKELLIDDTFLVINGKIVTDIDLSLVYQTHKSTNAIATLVLLPNRRRDKFTIVNVEDGRLVGFGGMPDNNSPSDNDSIESPPLMFTGIQILEPRIFDYIPKGVFSHSTTDVYPKALQNGELISVHIADGNWNELSTLDRYLEISLLLNKNNYGVICGENCKISDKAFVSDSILWDNVTIESDTRITRSIIGDGVSIKAKEIIENAVVVRADLIKGEVIPSKALKGEMIGENFIVPLQQ